MATIIPAHKHTEPSGSIFQAPERSVHITGSMGFPEGRRLILALTPIVGLFYAAYSYCQLLKNLQALTSSLGFTPSLKCQSEACFSLLIQCCIPTALGILGGSGVLLPLFLIAIIVGAIFNLAKKLLTCVCSCPPQNGAPELISV